MRAAKAPVELMRPHECDRDRLSRTLNKSNITCMNFAKTLAAEND
jgi:hypothetical protein